MWNSSTRSISIPTGMLSLVTGLLMALPAAAAEPDISRGSDLFAENCSACHMVPHDEAWFEARAEQGNMNDYDSLRTMVQGCATNFGLPWFDEEVEAVTAYLNHKYYHFD